MSTLSSLYLLVGVILNRLPHCLQFIKPYIPASGPVIAALASGNFETISSTLTKKIKEEGGDQLKELEATAKKLYSKAEEVTKDKQLDVQSLIKQLKEGEWAGTLLSMRRSDN